MLIYWSWDSDGTSILPIRCGPNSAGSSIRGVSCVADEAVNRLGTMLEELGARFDLVIEAVSGFGGRLDALRDEILVSLRRSAARSDSFPNRFPRIGAKSSVRVLTWARR